MIKTQEEYKSALEFIDKDLEMYDFELPKKMNSYVYNLYLQDIEYYLDVLYEKYRTIEELCDYLEDYADTKISKAIDNIMAKKTSLEIDIDKAVDKQYKVYIPEWDTDYDVYDKEGNKLPRVHVDYNNNISPGRIYGNDITIKSVEKTYSNHQAYSDNIMTCLDDKHYISMYSLDEPDIIKEKIRFNVDPELFKYIELRPFNCEISIENPSEPEITLTSMEMKKTRENFNAGKYSGSTLNSLSAAQSDFNCNYTMVDNYNDITNTINNKNRQDYIKSVTDYQSSQADAENKSSAVTEGE